jgi:predicted RNA-binding protein with PUA-like domain
MAYWLVKTEPDDYSYTDLARAGTDTWDGVRNRQAQKYLGEMRPQDRVFIYHTGREKAVVGVAEVDSLPFPDPLDPTYLAVSLRVLQPLARAVTLREIKEAPRFAQWALVRQPRLSVMPVPEEYWLDVLDRGSLQPGNISGK